MDGMKLAVGCYYLCPVISSELYQAHMRYNKDQHCHIATRPLKDMQHALTTAEQLHDQPQLILDHK